MNRYLTITATTMLVAAAAVACTPSADDQADGNNTPSASSSSPGSEASPSDGQGSAQPIQVTRTLRGVPVQVSVDPVVTDGEVAVMTATFEVAAEDAAAFDEKVPQLDGLVGDLGDASGIRLVDSAAGTVLPVATDGEGEFASTFEEDDEAEGYVARTVSEFAAPSGDVVDLLVPSMGYVHDVPVTEADSVDRPEGDTDGSASADAVAPRAFERAYDDSESVDTEGKKVKVTLASDVLFDSSSAKLSSAAQKTVDDAAVGIKDSADAGSVAVVGHTDDVDTDAFNQKLSKQRADAVAARLQGQLGDGFKVSAEGRGESEPVAEGTSDEARAANRRVEIVFDGQKVSSPDSADGTIPKSEVPTARAGEPVAVSPREKGTYEVTVNSVTRSGDALLGTLQVELVKGVGTATMWGLLNSGVVGDNSSQARGLSVKESTYTAKDLTLLTERGRTYPYDYVIGKDDGIDQRRILGDTNLVSTPEEVGEMTLATAVWPDSGQDTVTLEVPGRFRITDIPVTDGAESD